MGMTAQDPAFKELFQTMIGFDTVSCDSNLELIDYVKNYLEHYGIESHLIYNDDETKANLVARIGPKVDGGVIFSGHSDVVPVDEQIWHTDPFNLTAKNDHYFGRGTCDMKGFVTTVLAQVPNWSRLELKKPIYLAISYDEEIGCRGVPSLIDFLEQQPVKADMAIIGEPTNMELVTTHKSIQCYKTTIHGVPSHSSRPQDGVNAILVASQLITYLESLFASYQQQWSDPIFDPNYCSFNIGNIQGGTAINIVAQTCSFEWEMRLLPTINSDDIFNAFDAQCQRLAHAIQADKKLACTIDHEPISKSKPLLAKEDSLCANETQNLLRVNERLGVSFATEAGFFQDSGIDTVVCGPGSIEQAHKPNEFVAFEQIDRCFEFTDNFVKNQCL